MTDVAPNTTQICGYDTQSISIRGRDLVNQLIGKLSFTQMIYLQLTGRMPSEPQVKLLDAVLVTIMEHGLVPSAMVTRLTHYGAPESFQGAVAAGLLGVGDQFAGTASACAALIGVIAAAPESDVAAEAARQVATMLANKTRIPGFGHMIHTEGDPRVAKLLGIVRDSGLGKPELQALRALESVVAQRPGRTLVTNVSAAIAVALAAAGVPALGVRGIVLTARCAGLSGHLVEEMQRPIAPALSKGAESAVRYQP
jgi:citrate synthase